MNLVIEKAAARVLLKLAPKARLALIERLEAVAADPFGRHPQVKPLQGATDMFRLRQGDWRALYRIDREADEMRVTDIAPRGGAYR